MDVHARLPVEFVEALDRVAAMEGVTRQDAIRLALAEWIRRKSVAQGDTQE